MKHYHYNYQPFEATNKRWSGVLIGSAAIGGAISGGVAMYEGSQNRKAAQKARDALASVQWQGDPMYQQSQDQLFPFYSDIMAGNIPEYYKGIGESGGPEYQKMMGLIQKDVMGTTAEGLTRMGISRGGLGADITGRAVGEAGTKFGWADYLRAMEGRKWLGSWGTTGMESVRSGALTNQGQINAFNISKMGGSLNLMGMENTQQAAQDKQMADMMSGIMGTAGNIYGMNQMKDMYGTKTAQSSMTYSPTGGYEDYTKMNASNLPGWF